MAYRHTVEPEARVGNTLKAITGLLFTAERPALVHQFVASSTNFGNRRFELDMRFHTDEMMLCPSVMTADGIPVNLS